jgi:hypothetical protein
MFIPRQEVLVFRLLTHLLDELDEVPTRDVFFKDKVKDNIGDVVVGNSGTMTAVKCLESPKKFKNVWKTNMTLPFNSGMTLPRA